MAWEKAAARKPKDFQRMLESQRPIRHLKFHEYMIGDLVMVTITPKQKLKHWIEKDKRTVSAALQPRYSGPYPITKVISPVVYIVKINGIDRVIHAVNMKLFKGKQTYMTPFVQHGFERSEAIKNIPEEPLLMSPDPGLNETARTQYKKKNLGFVRDYTRRSNLKKYRKDLNKELTERLSQPSESLERLLDEYADVEDDEEMVLHRQWLQEKGRRRKILLEVNSDFSNKSITEQENQLLQFDFTGHKIEDVVEEFLDQNETQWRKSLRNTSSSSNSTSTNIKPNSQDTDNNESVEIVRVKSNKRWLKPRRR
jgi:hypothetical protein